MWLRRRHATVEASDITERTSLLASGLDESTDDLVKRGSTTSSSTASKAGGLFCRACRHLFFGEGIGCQSHHPAIAMEVVLLQICIAVKSLALSTELNYAVFVNDRSTTLTNAPQIQGGTHFDSQALQFVLPDAIRVACGILDALVSGLLALLLLSTTAKRAGEGIALAVGALAVVATAADFVFLNALGTTLNAGVLALAARAAWMMRFVVLSQLVGGKSVGVWLRNALLVAALVGSAHMALVRGARRACSTSGQPALRLAAAGLLLRILLLPSHPAGESPSLVLRLSIEALWQALLLPSAATAATAADAAAAARHVALRRPVLEKLPRLVAAGVPSTQRANAGDDGPVGVVLLILESINADAVSPLYAPPDSGMRPTAPFLSSLARRRDTLAAHAHLATIPNTNKALVELLCGLTP